jgi:hypothetical protein
MTLPDGSTVLRGVSNGEVVVRRLNEKTELMVSPEMLGCDTSN